LIGEGRTRASNPTGIERIITHASPHADEYLAALFFRALVPSAEHLPLEETALFSARCDWNAIKTWQSAAVFGIGGKVSGGATPKLVFDEHPTDGSERVFGSCCSLVLSELLQGGGKDLPASLSRIVAEIDHIDACGGAHTLHLNNLIKGFHDLEFSRPVGTDGIVRYGLTPEWKEAVIAATYVAIAFALEESRLVDDRQVMLSVMDQDLAHHKQHSSFRSHGDFEARCQKMRSDLRNLPVIFKDAVWKRKDRSGFMAPVRQEGRTIPQILLLPRMILANREFWGEETGTFLNFHFLELLLADQLSFRQVRNLLDATDWRADFDTRTEVGDLGFRRMDAKRGGHWLLNFECGSTSLAVSRAVKHYFNEGEKNRSGVLLVRNTSLNTKALSRLGKFPQELWTRLVDFLIDREGSTDNPASMGCWHLEKRDGVYADFLLNGNPAHQYTPRSALDLDTLRRVLDDLAQP
jgi:hypothetical protein